MPSENGEPEKQDKAGNSEKRERKLFAKGEKAGAKLLKKIGKEFDNDESDIVLGGILSVLSNPQAFLEKKKAGKLNKKLKAGVAKETEEETREVEKQSSDAEEKKAKKKSAKEGTRETAKPKADIGVKSEQASMQLEAVGSSSKN